MDKLLRAPLSVLIGGAVAIVVIVVGLAVLLRLLRRQPEPERLRDEIPEEDLSEYPAAPAGKPRLQVQGVGARLRLVVVAPVGKGSVVDADAVPMLLNKLIHGLGSAVQKDRPRLRVWPAQLSNQGFAHVFHNHVQTPEAEGEPSQWILLAGPTPARPQPLLLGLALQSEETTSIGRHALKPEQWADMLHLQG